MGIEAALALADTILFTHTGKHLNDLQSSILRQVWHGQTYIEIADNYGCTEGHAKDIGSQLWKLLSEALGERITKSNFRTVMERKLSSYPLPSTAIAEASNFVGRKTAIAHLNTLVQQGSKVIVIQGEGGVGKTTLAQQFLEGQEFELVLELLMAKEPQNIASVENALEEWLKRDLNEEPGREFGVTLGRLRRQLLSRRIGILIDNLEPALAKDGRLIAPHRRYVELLRVLADARVKSVTLITSRDRLCEADLQVEHYRLPGLDELAWSQFFRLRQIQFRPETLQRAHKIYGGNAKAMGILLGAVREDFESDFNAYWQENGCDPLVETDLKNLVASQFNRLQVLDPEAYHLLCRLGCYRYQEISSVPRAGLLSLLWDVEQVKRRRLIESLRNRSLVEYVRGEYWLHPVIRAEALSRLTDAQQQTVHGKIAQFWTEKVITITSVQDAITALEAYYHYVVIQDYEQAGQVILKSRVNQWGQFLPLGSTLYRMGLLQPVMTAITQIIDRTQSGHCQSELYNILGDLYCITGQVKIAIAAQEKTLAAARESLAILKPLEANRHNFYYLRMLEVDALLSLGLYHIDLWELQQAACFFGQAITLAADTAHHRWAEKASICLALVNSYLGLTTEATRAAKAIYHAIVNSQSSNYSGRFAYFMQILGQTYVNLGKFPEAMILLERAISFSQESHYPQVQAKALTSLAQVSRQQQNWDNALSYSLEAIALLDQIGAKCDLAEAYFQYGLTAQQLGDLSKSSQSFEKALQLFAQIEASKQLERVRESSNNR